MLRVVGFILIICSIFSWALSREWIRTSGDVLQVAIPVYSLGTTYGDNQGFWQMTSSFVLAQGLVVVTKKIVQRKRPDYEEGDTRDSFPSGHTASAFSGASFIHFRYGFKEALPFYGLATWVGYSRVYAKKHHVTDVLASAILATGINYLMITPKTPSGKQKTSFASFALDPASKGAFLVYFKAF